MKNILFTILLIGTSLVYSQEKIVIEKRYWSDKEEAVLTQNPSIKFCVFKQSFMLDSLELLEKNFSVISQGIDNTSNTLKITAACKSSLNRPWALIKSSNGNWESSILNSNSIFENYGFSNLRNKEIGLSHLFYIQLKQLKDSSLLYEYAHSQNIDILGQNKFMPTWFTASCISSGKSTLEVVNTFYESNNFRYCEPDLMISAKLDCVNDPEFVDGNLWAHNNIHSCNAWNITAGDPNITIAIFDTGIDMVHEDLTANIHPLSFDSESGTSPSQNFGDHGTHCAGIAAAVGNNDTDVVGVAHNCRLMSVSNSMSISVNSRQSRADGISWAWQNGADVISNSWSMSLDEPMLNQAISEALNQGRNGLGTIVVFSSGNNFYTNGSGGYDVFYPANSNPNILVVGSTTNANERSSFSRYGDELDVVAPGSNILSTVLNNEVGVKEGTSMACPHAAGLAALILSLDPCLTREEVVDIIELSAQKVGGVMYQANPSRPNGSWNEEMGYGLIDAEAALQMVLNQFLLQDETETGSSLVNSTLGEIRAGKDVTSLKANNPYIIASNGKVEFKATQNISLEDGFITSPGAKFLAHIQEFDGNCITWNTSNLRYVPTQTFATEDGQR